MSGRKNTPPKMAVKRKGHYRCASDEKLWFLVWLWNKAEATPRSGGTKLAAVEQSWHRPPLAAFTCRVASLHSVACSLLPRQLCSTNRAFSFHTATGQCHHSLFVFLGGIFATTHMTFPSPMVIFPPYLYCFASFVPRVSSLHSSSLSAPSYPANFVPQIGINRAFSLHTAT